MFLASDVVLNPDVFTIDGTHPVILGLATICRSAVHTFAITTLIVIMLEVLIAFYSKSSVCSRVPYAEYNSLVSVSFVVISMVVEIANTLFDNNGGTIAKFPLFLCRAVPFGIGMCVLTYQLIQLFPLRKTRPAQVGLIENL